MNRTFKIVKKEVMVINHNFGFNKKRFKIGYVLLIAMIPISRNEIRASKCIEQKSSYKGINFENGNMS
jgi:hypothetical protein